MIRIFLDNSLVLFISLVSKKIQIIAKREVKGIDASIPAIIVDLLVISDIATTIIAVNKTLIVIYIKIYLTIKQQSVR